MIAVTKTAPRKPVKKVEPKTNSKESQGAKTAAVIGLMCDGCKKPFFDWDIIRVKDCKHTLHKACLDAKTLPPGCDNCKASKPIVENIQFAETKGYKGVKYVGYLVVAIMVAGLALVIHTSFMSLAVGCGLAIPLGYVGGRKLEAWFQEEPSKVVQQGKK